MTSPTINWDDFSNQALIVQELLSHSDKTADPPHFKSKTPEPEDSPQLISKMGKSEDSPLFITKMAVPQGLVLMSPDTLLDDEKAVNDKFVSKQKYAEVRTPLNNCDRTSPSDIKVLTDNMMVTPEKSTNSEESSRVICPSSAEFRKFLSDIMEVSPVVEDCNFENLREVAVTKCQSLVVTEPTEDLPVVKVRARTRTYDLVSSDTLIDSTTTEKTEAVVLSPIKKVNEINGCKQKDSEVKTPLKDCTNTSQRDRKILKNDMMITPEISKMSEESTKVLYPSVVEFRKFLNDIMEDSPIVKNGNLGLGEELVKQCQSLVVTEPTKDLPVVKFGVRNGTYDLDSPDICSETAEKTKSLALSPVKKVNEISEHKQNDTVVKFRSRSGTYDLDFPSYDLSGLCDLESKSSLQEAGISTNQTSNLLMLDSDTESKNDMSNKDNNFPASNTNKNESIKVLSKEDKSEELGLDRSKSCEAENYIQAQLGTKIQKELLVVSDNYLNTDALKPCKKQLARISSLRRPQSGFSSANDKNSGRDGKQHTPALEIIYTDPISCSQDESNCGGETSVVSGTKDLQNGMTVPEPVDNLQEKNELAFLNVSDKSPQIQLNDITCVTQNICSLEGNTAENQRTLDAAPRQETMLNKRVSTSHLVGKASFKADTKASNALPKKAPLTKLPLMKPGQLQSKLTLKRPSFGFTSSKQHNALPTGQETKGNNSVILPKVTLKQQTGSSSLGHKDSLGASKLPAKHLFRPPPKIIEQSQGSLKSQLISDKLKINTKVSEHEVVKIKQPSNAINKSDASKPATNMTKRLSVVKDIQATSTVVKDKSNVIKPSLPVTDASKTVTKEAVKVSMKAVAQADESAVVTNKASPVKSLFPVKDSRTVILEVQPANSRTITKEAQPAGSRTITKTSSGQPSDACGNHLGTPTIGDKFLVPRRLSNVFHSPSTVSGNMRDKKHNSSIPTPTRYNRHSSQSSQGSTWSNSSFRKPSWETSFPSTGSSGDDSEVFKVDTC